MLILAGVSLNALVGDNGIIANAQLASLESRFAKYKEEMQINFVEKIAAEAVANESQITVLNDGVKKYITSLADEDIGQFGIIAGQLYYIGDNELEMKVATRQGIEIKPDNVSLEDFIGQMETLAIESLVVNNGGNAFKNEDNNPLGVPLYNKTLENANRWRLITEVENNTIKATYGTDWYYVIAGTNVEGIGELSKSYIINYNTRKYVIFNPMIHSMLSFESTIGISDNLFFNFDPGILADVTNSEGFSALDSDSKLNILSNAMGDGAQIVNMNLNDYGSNITGSEIDFDGIDDAITIDYSDDIMKQKIINQGFTFEFYGIIDEGGISFIDYDAYGGYNTNPTYTDEQKQNKLAYDKKGVNGILMYTIPDTTNTWIAKQEQAKINNEEIARQKEEGTYVEPPKVTVDYGTRTMEEDYLGHHGSVDALALRFSLISNGTDKFTSMRWNCAKGYYGRTASNCSFYNTLTSPYNEGNLFNIATPLEINHGDVVYLTICLDPNEIVTENGVDYVIYRIYLNGELIIQEKYNKEVYRYFTDYGINDLGQFHIGRTIYNSSEYFYSKLNVYTTRLYSRALSNEEVMSNYNNSVSYHEFLVNESSGSTGGDTGGTGF